ncbi:hypothetical protein [Nitratireductor sp. OM-1]|uniref:hypothetical protein n=1 Tax=Nitratireductor sp. OM-1 TaxID=1756988 RepID=UPI000DDD526F|nr:hypothetical protein [Nitratireductor sp. OM-1]
MTTNNVARKIGQFAIENEERRSRCQGPALLSINIAALCLVSIGVTPALAQQTSWTAGSAVNQVNWYDNANWDSGRPGTGLNAFIKMPAGSNMPIINGGTALAGDIYVGSDASASIGDGRLIMQNGSILNSDEGYIDHNASAGNNNGVFVSGAQWNNLQLVVGNLNHGLMQITNGGKVTSDIVSGAGLSTGGKGEVIITGPGSQWSITNGDLKLGGSGEGVMKIANGGKMGVKSGAGTLLLAEYTGSFGGLAIGGMQMTLPRQQAHCPPAKSSSETARATCCSTTPTRATFFRPISPGLEPSPISPGKPFLLAMGAGLVGRRM